ncbi:MAG: hypothetical protein WC197_05840 [Candidatus Gastranaerophilaceae bacterium]|jgi:uridine kinase
MIKALSPDPKIVSFNCKKSNKITPNENHNSFKQTASLMSFQAAQTLKAQTLASISFQSKKSLDIDDYKEQIKDKIIRQRQKLDDYKIKLTAEYIEGRLNRIIINDKKLNKPLFRYVRKGFIHKLAEKIARNPYKTITIGIAGESASGKTNIANKILNGCNEINPNMATMISCDNYYSLPKGINEAGGLIPYLRKTDYNIDCPDAVDLDAFKSDFKKIASGVEQKIPVYDFKTFSTLPEGALKKPAKILMGEGLFTLTDKIKDLFDIKIYVHRKTETIKKHWYDRAPERSINNKKDQDFLFEKAINGGKKYVQPSMKNADLIINRNCEKEEIKNTINEIYQAISDVRKLSFINVAA